MDAGRCLLRVHKALCEAHDAARMLSLRRILPPGTAQMGNCETTDPTLALDLVERVLEKLGLRGRPSPDLAGLNAVLAAVCGGIPFDNIRKRIWFERIRKGPFPGGEPTDFFESWLAHGAAGTCWPINGALHALLVSLGFPVRRGAGGVMFTPEEDTNHGTVLVALDGVDYLADLNIGSFKALPLVPGKADSTGEGIHDIRAVPFEDRFEVTWYTGHSRKRPLLFAKNEERSAPEPRLPRTRSTVVSAFLPQIAAESG